ncbi:Hypothetical predicted protein [Octopus vulgaris]|uniref:Uncharacterized protein n=1 Tax=Octopus vulgaris TaxID=6645 RepID=A0AA36AYB2_OCTVU|nr:Hypothetical predicted protein [Octopus vulgaris]
MPILYKEEDQKLVNALQVIWDGLYQQVHNLNLNDRPYNTSLSKEPSKLELEAVNEITNNYLKTTESRCMKVTYATINLLAYVSAVTLLAYHKELKPRNRDSSRKPEPARYSLNTKTDELSDA